MATCRPTNETIPASDGLPLAASLFPSARPTALGTLLIAGAVGNLRHGYRTYAGYMAERGWDVLTFDYRGMGESAASPQETARFTMLDWAEKDLSGVIDWARRRLNPRRLVLVGHSIGGQLAGLATNCAELDALVGVAAQRGYWPYWTGPRKYLLYLFFGVYVPLAVKRHGFLPMGLAGLENLPAGVARDWARWGIAKEYRDRTGSLLRPRFARFTAPILALSFSDDLALAPKRAVDVLFSEHYVNAPVTRWHVHPEDFERKQLGHSGFFSRRVRPERLWQAVSEWILAACPGERKGDLLTASGTPSSGRAE
ncbi:MAG: alpha/beta hydrolase family protein [Gemmataceae bacterium]